MEQAVEQVEGADKVIVTAYTSNTNEAQQQLVEELQSTGKEVIVTSMRNPYNIMAFPDIEANVLTYGFEEISVEALAKVLTGEVNPAGKLPVTIPELYDYGHGLSY
ncbi:glycoside hydrolase family 3 C-terminal domain-containing protein [Halobacillus sp. A5]|uniref:glycoside hydrolase family 3 protein n=1 Tax=Halobacillus sp. A5 TaxID=2880263 RepID=UPI003531EF13|nr:glycoside hydrolase family 3 C-terminal domain-containing protein [Halobacillus sp. A5]